MVSTKKNSTLSKGSVTKNKCSHVDHEDEAALGSFPALSSSDFWEGPARKHAPGHKLQALKEQATS